MSIGKEQLRDLFKSSLPKSADVRDIRVKTREGEEKDFEELIFLMDMPITVPARKE